MTRRVVALLVVLGVAASGSACVKKNEDKNTLQRIVERSGHESGVFRYSDLTPKTTFSSGSLVQVRGVVEDDFRYKARLTVDGQDAIDEVVNDDALAVRFLDPSFVDKFTSGAGEDAGVKEALEARYWVVDTTGAPSIGDAAVTDRTIGIDPIVDSLSVNGYVLNAIFAAVGVHKFNAERLDYRPKEDPFPRPEQGSGVTRWDLDPPKMPRADDLSGGAADSSLARAPVFRQMAIYVKNGKVVQIRERLSAKFDRLNQFRNYILQLTEKTSQKAADSLKRQLDKIQDQPDLMEAVLSVALNQVLALAGEEVVRFHTVVYEFAPAEKGAEISADLPYGPDVKDGSLAFFGVNSKAGASAKAKRTSGETTTTTTTAAP